MYSQCPECLTIQAITPTQLRANKGVLQCSHCAAYFDGLERLNDTEDAIPPPAQPDLPWEQPAPAPSQRWGAGLLLGLSLFLWQAYYFEGHALSQNPQLRPKLESICHFLGCRLPDYTNTDELTVLEGSFSPMPDSYYAFRMVFSNQAAFAQPYPNIKLSLLDYNGNTFAMRVFKPKDYLVPSLNSHLMPANTTTELNLKMAPPKASIGGSRFDFSY